MAQLDMSLAEMKEEPILKCINVNWSLKQRNMNYIFMKIVKLSELWQTSLYSAIAHGYNKSGSWK